ncbi:hypothetical protein LguiB_032565 [Lonicera macranthoides]
MTFGSCPVKSKTKLYWFLIEPVVCILNTINEAELALNCFLKLIVACGNGKLRHSTSTSRCFE